MMIEVVKSKIHRVTVTEANLNYIGSITIDQDLLDAANLIPNEKVSIVRAFGYVCDSRRERVGRDLLEWSGGSQGATGRHRDHHVLCHDGFRGS